MGEVLQRSGLVEALAGLPGGSWIVVGEAVWPTATLTEGDCVVIGPGGVFVVVGAQVGARPATVLLDAPWVDGEFRGDLVERSATAAGAVLDLVPGVDPRHVHAVLCFAQQPMLVERCEEVLVCSTANVVSVLTSRMPVLNTRQVHTIHARLRAGLRRARPGLGRVPAQSDGGAAAGPRPRGLLVGVAVAVVLLVAAGLGMAAVELEGPVGHAIGVGALAGSRTSPLTASPGQPLTVTWPGHPAGVRVTVRDVRRTADGQHVEVRLVLLGLGHRTWHGSITRAVQVLARDGRRFRASAGPRVVLRPRHPVRTAVVVALPPQVRPDRVEVHPARTAAAVAAWRIR